MKANASQGASATLVRSTSETTVTTVMSVKADAALTETSARTSMSVSNLAPITRIVRDSAVLLGFVSRTSVLNANSNLIIARTIQNA